MRECETTKIVASYSGLSVKRFISVEYGTPLHKMWRSASRRRCLRSVARLHTAMYMILVASGKIVVVGRLTIGSRIYLYILLVEGTRVVVT